MRAVFFMYSVKYTSDGYYLYHSTTFIMISLHFSTRFSSSRRNGLFRNLFENIDIIFSIKKVGALSSPILSTYIFRILFESKQSVISLSFLHLRFREYYKKKGEFMCAYVCLCVPINAILSLSKFYLTVLAKNPKSLVNKGFKGILRQNKGG